jgi:hypothetical protein
MLREIIFTFFQIWKTITIKKINSLREKKIFLYFRVRSWIGAFAWFYGDFIFHSPIGELLLGRFKWLTKNQKVFWCFWERLNNLKNKWRVRNWNNFVIYSGFGQVTKYLFSYSSRDLLHLKNKNIRDKNVLNWITRKWVIFWVLKSFLSKKIKYYTYFTASEMDWISLNVFYSSKII